MRSIHCCFIPKQELWVLLNFIEPFKFPDLDDFQRNFGNMANKEQVENLQQLISPYMLRRIKEDVATDIPSKEETVIDVELTSIQKQYYRAIFEHNHAFLSLGSTRTNAPKLMNIQMELRKVSYVLITNYMVCVEVACVATLMKAHTCLLLLPTTGLQPPLPSGGH